MNNLTLIGRVGADAVVSTVGTSKVINFNVCHSEKYKDKNGVLVEKNIWFSCSKFGDNTNVAQYIRKGDLIYASGNVEIRSYEKDNKTYSTLQVRVNEIQLLGSSQNKPQQSAPELPSEAPSNNFLDDSPF